MKKLIQWFIPIFTAVLFVGCITPKKDTKLADDQSTTQKMDWAIAIHGGAGTIPHSTPDSVVKTYKQDLSKALSIGVEILKKNGKAIDACEQVLRYFENNPNFNAGVGSVYTHNGHHEMDAAIMIGNTRQAGAITGIKTVKHPISLARKVLEESKHVFLAGEGAENFADKVGVARVPNSYFDTKEAYKALQRALEDDQKTTSAMIPLNNKTEWYNALGTTGCVARDTHGTLVAGTTTGGMTNKMYGRVGDVPIIGAGTYASKIVAVSMTGWGEKIMKAVSGHTVHAYLKWNEKATLKEAGMYLLTDVLNPDEAGMIAVDRHGHVFMHTNTDGMYRAMANSKGEKKVALWN